jgi:aspartate/methionine/tyrosine aminotransferase
MLLTSEVTNGASAALYYSLVGWLNDGDEVILIEPFFSMYREYVCSKKLSEIINQGFIGWWKANQRWIERIQKRRNCRMDIK